MTARVRLYKPTDKPACIAIFASNIPDYFDATEQDNLAHFLDDPGGAYFVIEQDGRVIGSGGFVKEGRGQARFTWGMVHREHHRDGLGRLLAKYRLEQIAKTGAFTEVELFTTPRVAPFFTKFGFAGRHVEKDGIAPGMDKVQMIKMLQNND